MIQKIYDFCHFCFYYHYDHHYHYHHHHWCHCHCQILNLFDLTIKTRYHTWCFKRFMIFVVVVVVVVDVIVIIIVVICRYYLDLLPCKIWRFPNFRQEIRQSHYRNDPVKYDLNSTLPKPPIWKIQNQHESWWKKSKGCWVGFHTLSRDDTTEENHPLDFLLNG